MGRAGAGIALGWALAMAPGCAVHYRRPSTGAEGLVGVGRLSLVQNGASVASGVLAPGLSVGLSEDYAGVAVGWAHRERIGLHPGAQVEAPRAGFGWAWKGSRGSLWGIGWLRMRTPASRVGGGVVATAGAVAGLGLGVEGGSPELSVGLRSAQRTRVEQGDGAFELRQGPVGWPGFDLVGSSLRRIAVDTISKQGTDP